MKLFPILTALVVAAVIFGIVIERDAFRQLLGGAPVETAAEATPAEPSALGTPKHDTLTVVAVDSIAREIDNQVILRGRTEADRQVTVMSQTSGLIVAEPLRKGSFVRAGDILCEVEPGTRPAALAEARAKLAEAEITKTAAERLVQGGFTSETQAKSALAAWESAAAAVLVAETEMSRLHIQAPFDGVLETDTAELGVLMQPGAACANIIRLDPIRLVGFLPEVLVGAVDLGAVATARLSTGDKVTGKVVFVSRAADEATRTFRVDIEVPNPDLQFRDGQTAEIAITARGTAAHLLPQSALTLDDDGRMGVRIVDAQNVVEFVPVAMVRDTAEGVLLTGLPAEARVIVIGQEYVTDGVQVAVTRPEDRS